MSEREYKDLKRRLKEKFSVLRSERIELMADHFKKYPWGMTYGEAANYLMDHKVDGTSINQEVEPFLAKYPGGEVRKRFRLLKNHFQTTLNSSLRNMVRSRLNKDYFETPKWNDFVLAFLSKKYRVRRKGGSKRNVVDRRVRDGTKFFAPTQHQLWARLFIEAEEDIDRMTARKKFPILGYSLLEWAASVKKISQAGLKQRHGKEATVTNVTKKLEGLQELGLISTQRGNYLPTKLTLHTFAHVDKHKDTRKDIRRWPWRYNIIYPTVEK